MTDHQLIESLRGALGKFGRHEAGCPVLWPRCQKDNCNCGFGAALADVPPEPLIGTTRDWTEDAAHENGSYANQCSVCGKPFVGHKRRSTCKLCEANSNTFTGMIMDPPGAVLPLAVEPMEARKEWRVNGIDVDGNPYEFGESPCGMSEADVRSHVLFRQSQTHMYGDCWPESRTISATPWEREKT